VQDELLAQPVIIAQVVQLHQYHVHKELIAQETKHHQIFALVVLITSLNLKLLHQTVLLV
jgi:hypothetical protein